MHWPGRHTAERGLHGEKNATVELAAGLTRVTFDVKPTEAGFHTFRAVVEAARDTFSQNDRADTNTIVKGEPRTLVLAGDDKVAAELVAALKNQRELVDGDGGEAASALEDAGLEATAGAVGGVVEDAVAVAVGEPDAGQVAGGEDGDAGRLDGGGEVHGAAIVAEEEAGAGEDSGALARGGHTVCRLVRPESTGGASAKEGFAVAWNPATGELGGAGVGAGCGGRGGWACVGAG